MKKLLIAVFALCLGISALAGAKAGDDYNAMDLGIWFGLPTSAETSNIRGLRLGIPIASGGGYVSGLEFALFCAATDEIEGLQFAPVALTKQLTGLQVSLVNVCDGEANGTQVGVVNSAGKRGWQLGLVNIGNNAKFQLGLINMNKDGWMPAFLFFNFGKDTFK